MKNKILKRKDQRFRKEPKQKAQVQHFDALPAFASKDLVPSILEQKKQEARQKGRKFRLPKQNQKKSLKPVEMSYSRELLKIVNSMIQGVQEYLITALPMIVRLAKQESPSLDSMRSDTYEQEIERALRLARAEYSEEFTEAEYQVIAERISRRVNVQSYEEFTANFKKVLGIALVTQEPWLQAQIGAFVKENVSLIKTIPEQYFSGLEQSLLRKIQQGVLTKNIEKDLVGLVNENGKKAQKRAKVIARDQVNKFYGQLEMKRQMSVGISKYRWKTSLDERVRGNPFGKYPKARPSHWARQNEIFSWDNPPEDGHPGQPIMCRCRAEPIFAEDE